MNIRELKQSLVGCNDSAPVRYLSPIERFSDGSIVDTEYKNNFLVLKTGASAAVTVKELSNRISDLPDDVIVTIDTAFLEKNNKNILRYVSENTSKTAIAVNDKANEDVAEELNARAESRSFLALGDSDMLQTCFDDGFTMDDFKDAGDSIYKWAVRTKEEFGCIELQERYA